MMCSLSFSPVLAVVINCCISMIEKIGALLDLVGGSAKKAKESKKAQKKETEDVIKAMQAERAEAEKKIMDAMDTEVQKVMAENQASSDKVTSKSRKIGRQAEKS